MFTHFKQNKMMSDTSKFDTFMYDNHNSEIIWSLTIDNVNVHHKTGHFSITNYLFSADFGCPIPKFFYLVARFLSCEVTFMFIIISLLVCCSSRTDKRNNTLASREIYWPLSSYCDMTFRGKNFFLSKNPLKPIIGYRVME